MGKEENNIQKLILEYLFYNKIFAWRNSTGTYKVRGHFYKFGKVGSGDIIGVYKGRFLSIEVKTETGIVSKEQKEFIKRINDDGGIAFVARNLDDVKKHFK